VRVVDGQGEIMLMERESERWRERARQPDKEIER